MAASTCIIPPYPCLLEEADAELAELALRDKAAPLPTEDSEVTELAIDTFRLCPPPPTKSGTLRDAQDEEETTLASARRRLRSSFRSSRLRSARAKRR